MKVRFFGGYTFDNTILSDPEWISKAYASGVPMGGDLQGAGSDKAPTFLIQAIKKTNGANLDRIQIIKGWEQNGQTYEKIYDVAPGESAGQYSGKGLDKSYLVRPQITALPAGSSLKGRSGAVFYHFTVRIVEKPII